MCCEHLTSDRLSDLESVLSAVQTTLATILQPCSILCLNSHALAQGIGRPRHDNILHCRQVAIQLFIWLSRINDIKIHSLGARASLQLQVLLTLVTLLLLLLALMVQASGDQFRMAVSRGAACHHVAFLIDLELLGLLGWLMIHAIGSHDGLFLRCGRLLLSLHHNLMPATSLSVLKLASATLGSPSHFIALASLFEHLHSIEIFHRDQLLLEVVCLEVLVRGKAKYFLLFELAHQYFLHLSVRQLAIIVETQRLHTTFIVLLKLKLVLDYVYPSLKDAFVLDGLANGNFTSTST